MSRQFSTFHINNLLSFFCFLDDVRLRILPSSKAKIQHLIAANFPFHPSIQIEIVDNQTQRIKTGNYSSLVRFTFSKMHSFFEVTPYEFLCYKIIHNYSTILL